MVKSAPKRPTSAQGAHQGTAIDLQLALDAHGKGKFPEAAAAYRKVLAVDPTHAIALANLGSVYARLEQYTDALACYQTALQGKKVSAELWFNYGNLQQRMGMLEDAAQSFEHALKLNPDIYPAHYNLANLRRDLEQDDEALNHYRATIRLKPDFAPAYRNLGNLLRRIGRHAEAIEQHRIAIKLEPGKAENHFNLANALTDADNLQAAIEHHRLALRLAPDMTAAHLNLGNLYQTTGDTESAERHYRQAITATDAPVAAYINLIRLNQTPERKEACPPIITEALSRYPDNIELLRLHGESLYRQDDAVSALAVYQKIEALQPGDPNTRNAIGVMLRAIGQLDEAEKAWRYCLNVNPQHVEALTNLGTLCRLQKRHEEALSHLRRAIEIRPDDCDSITSLSCALIDLGFISEALGMIEPALAKEPEHADLLGMKAYALVHQARIDESHVVFAKARSLLPNSQVGISNSLFSSLYSDSLDAAALARFHQELAAGVSRNAKRCPMRRLPKPDGRVLRIGYLSPDFRSHPIGFFISPVLQHHHADQFHVICYALPCAPDELTNQLKGYAHQWRDFEGWTLDRMAAQIQDDQLDILIDLAGYTAGGRMDLMARKTTPIQAVFLGYPSSTGLAEMDYIIADHHLIPPTQEHLYTERPARLPHSFLCYRPQPGAPAVSPLPVATNGYITFGSYNNLPKISGRSMDLWTKVLQAVPNSRLALMASSLADIETQKMFRQHFVRRGIAGERIITLPPVSPLPSFLAEYRRIDIALDPIPYNGGTTSCDALWMGAPVVTLTGEGFVGRMGTSLLNTIGHREWIASTEDEYVRIAQSLAADINALKEIRTTLRDDIMRSGLYDAQGYTSSLEGLYRQMVETHCNETAEDQESTTAPERMTT